MNENLQELVKEKLRIDDEEIKMPVMNGGQQGGVSLLSTTRWAGKKNRLSHFELRVGTLYSEDGGRK